MVLVTFDHSNEAAFNATVPKEQVRIQQLKEQGILEAVFVALDGSRGWTVLHGESREHVVQTMQTFPLFPFMSTEFVRLIE